MSKVKYVVLSLVAMALFISMAVAGIHQRDRDRDCDPGTGDRVCICQQFIDVDGDGIPNGQDDDYTPPQDGSGQQKGRR